MNGKCPYCSKPITHLVGNGVNVNFTAGTNFKGVTYSCPSCNTVLSCQIDPVALKTDTVKEVLTALRGGQR